MKNKIFIDTDIILDLFLERKPHCEYAADLFVKIETNEINGYVSSLIFSNLFYILRKEKSAKEAIIILKKLNHLVDILLVDKNIVEKALDSNFKDFEDALQYYTAKNNGINIIITRNISDYLKYIDDSSAITAKEFLVSLEVKKKL
jgi:predicted nucleic acid-binding protein